MRQSFIALVMFLFIVGLSGCIHEDDETTTNNDDEEEESSEVDFTSFVKVTLTVHPRVEPRPVNNVDFQFNDRENTDAYADVVDD